MMEGSWGMEESARQKAKGKRDNELSASGYSLTTRFGVQILEEICQF